MPSKSAAPAVDTSRFSSRRVGWNASPLRIGPTDDALEAEAHRVADQVIGANGLSGSITPGAPRISRVCSACDEAGLQREPSAARQPGPAAPSIVHEALRSSGQPLDPTLRGFYEPRFRHGFSAVRIHTDGLAAESARSVEARAYTVGRDVVFGSGQYSPHTERGRRLIAHELTHVVQQESGAVRRVQRNGGGTGDSTEKAKAADTAREEAMAQVVAIENKWKKLKRITSGFSETKGWITVGDTVVLLIRDHATKYLDASAAGDTELVNDYKFLVESDLVAYQYVAWHAFVYANLARLRSDINSLVSAFEHDKTHYTGRTDAEAEAHLLKRYLDSLSNDSQNTLADIYTGQIKARAGQTNEVTMIVTTAADKKKRAALETETQKIKDVQIAVQQVLGHLNKFTRNATFEGLIYAAEAVKEFVEVRNKIIDTTGGPDYDDNEHLDDDKGSKSDTEATPKGDDKGSADLPADAQPKQQQKQESKRNDIGGEGGGSGKWACYGYSAVLQIPNQLPDHKCPYDGQYVSGPTMRASNEPAACVAAKHAFNAMMPRGCRPKHLDCRCSKVR